MKIYEKEPIPKKFFKDISIGEVFYSPVEGYFMKISNCIECNNVYAVRNAVNLKTGNLVFAPSDIKFTLCLNASLNANI